MVLTGVTMFVSAHMDLSDLHSRGWLLVNGVSSAADLLELGKAVGVPVAAPNGELVKELRQTPQNEARKGTQSAIYGTGPFPLHTDTAFLPLPVRFIVLRASGDV